MVNTNKRNLTAYVPDQFHKRIKDFIKKESESPERSGIKLSIREFIIKAAEEYLNNHGG